MSDILNLNCTANSSCGFINIIGAPSTQTNIYCTDWRSCQNAVFNNKNTQQSVNLICDAPIEYRPCTDVIFHASNTDNVNVICSYQYACSYMSVDVRNADNVAFIYVGWGSGRLNKIYTENIRNTLYIECKEGMACDSMNIYPNSFTIHNELLLDLYCYGDNSCYNTQIHCPNPNGEYTTLMYGDNSLYTLECDNNICCPNIVTKCEAGTDCVIDCFRTQCQTKYIDGSLAKSLTVNCMNDKSCYKTKIQCPNGNSTVCNINCLDSAGCYYMSIDAEYTNVLTLNCSDRTSCQHLDLVKGPMNEAVIECSNWFSCAWTEFNIQNTNIVNVNCEKGSSACYDTVFHAENASVVNLNCLGWNGNNCEGTKLFVNYSNTVMVVCNSTKSCHTIEIYGDMAGSLDLKCNGNSSCDDSKIYCPYSNSNVCKIDCLAPYACDSMGIVVDNGYTHGYLDLKCNLNSCDNVTFECISPFNSYTKIMYGYNLTTWQCEDTNFNSCCPYLSNIPTTTNMNEFMFSSTIQSFPPTNSSILTELSNDQSDKDAIFTMPRQLMFVIILYCSLAIVIITILIAVICWWKKSKIKPKITEKHVKYDKVNKNSIEFNLDNNDEPHQCAPQNEQFCHIAIDSIDREENNKFKLQIQEENLDRMESNESMYDNPNAPVIDTSTGLTHEDNRSHELLKNWMQTSIGSVQYYNNFVACGYDSIDLIKTITIEEELINIDIINKQHRKKIMTEINKLRNNLNNDIELMKVLSNESMYDNPSNQLNRIGSNESMYVNTNNETITETATTTITNTTNNSRRKVRKYVIEWKTKDVINWVLNVENGRYCKFKHGLTVGFNDEQVNGENIKDINEQDLRHYGVNILSDRKDLIKHIHHLVNSEMYAPQVEGVIDDVSVDNGNV